MQNRDLNNVFSLVGAGRLGMTIAYSLVKKGWILHTVVSRTEKSIEHATSILNPSFVSDNFDDLKKSNGSVFLAVPDDALPSLASSLVDLDSSLDSRVVLHFSGATPSSVLEKVCSVGAHVGALHPLYSFPLEPRSLPKGVLFVYEGDTEAERTADQIIKTLNGIKRTIDASRKPLYHCGASLGGSASIVLLHLASRLIRDALDSPEQDYRQELAILAKSVLENLQDADWKTALTGPLKRGDKSTIEGHRKALAQMGNADADEAYDMLGRLVKKLLTEE